MKDKELVQIYQDWDFKMIVKIIWNIKKKKMMNEIYYKKILKKMMLHRHSLILKQFILMVLNYIY